ncbi:MAG TPA: hypothetical protein IAC22_05225 [Candidatus Caccocola faecipullorum]|nr:hypothetical protein [Candidatus Caccocola faecipullorum]
MKAAGPLNLPSVRDEGPVSVRRDTNSPEAAGFMRAAQARASGGDAIARGVQAFAAGIDKMAEDRDRAKALAAYNDYVTKSSELLYNADSGFMNAQGAGAEGLAYRVNEAHNTLRGEVAEGLSSRQRRLFMESAASYDRDVARSAMRYEGRAMAEYRRTEGARTLENMAAAFAAAPDDISIETQEESIYSVTMALFGNQGEEANAANVRSVRSDFISKAALLIAERDPLRAEAFVRENAGLMDEAAAEATRIKVEASALEAHLQQDTPLLFEEYGFDGLADARAYIRDNYSGDEEEKRISAAESYWREQWSDRNAREAKAYDDIIGMMEDGASAHQVKEAINSFGWSTRLAKRQVEDEYMRHYRIGDYAPSVSDTVHTDRNTLLALWELQDGGTLLDVAPDFASFKAQFGDRLSTTDLRTYRNYYSDLEKGVAKQNVAIKMNYGSVFRKMIEEEGIKDEQKTAHYLDRFNADYDALVRDAKGKPVTNQMAVTLMQDILAPEVVGQKKGPLWSKTDITVRRGDIPRGAERGADGRWYIADEYGHYRPIIFPGTEGSAGTAEIDWDLPPVM